MAIEQKRDSRESILAAILSEENFWPSEPRSLKDMGLPISYIEALIMKRLSVVGMSSGRQLASVICLPFYLLEKSFQSLRQRQLIVHKGSAPLNDYTYCLTQDGQDRARIEMQTCAYVGPAPVPLDDYVVSAEAQTIRAESPKRKQLENAFRDISVNRDIFETLGPAVNSGAGLFLYGEPGNGKTTLAQRVIRCFGQQIWIPYALIDDGQIIKLYDPSLHEVSEEENDNLSNFDQRWVRIRRPTVVVGGELTLDSLEIRHDPVGNVSEAPLQLKSNCGCFLIDDFGRQRVEPAELLNRWIVPLESRIDYLTLSTGKKIQVPFEQLIVFSTNLDPSELVDEAFLRRIPYKVFVGDPEPKEFHALFKYYASKFKCEYKPKIVDNLLARHYFRQGRPLRRCHPRDLLQQVQNYCHYNDIRVEMRDEYFDHVVRSYFSDAVITEHRAAKLKTNKETVLPIGTDDVVKQNQDPTSPIELMPVNTVSCDAKELAQAARASGHQTAPVSSQTTPITPSELAAATASPSVPAENSPACDPALLTMSVSPKPLNPSESNVAASTNNNVPAGEKSTPVSTPIAKSAPPALRPIATSTPQAVRPIATPTAPATTPVLSTDATPTLPSSTSATATPTAPSHSLAIPISTPPTVSAAGLPTAPPTPTVPPPALDARPPAKAVGPPSTSPSPSSETIPSIGAEFPYPQHDSVASP